MTIKEIIDDERIDLAMQLDMLSETELNIIDFAFERIEDAVMKRIAELEKELAEEARLNGMGAEREAKLLARVAELEAQNLNMMALFRDFYDLEFSRDECWEIIKKYGGEA